MIDINYVELGNVCEVVRGGSPRPIMDYITDDADGVNWLKIGDVSETDKFFTHAKERIKPSGIPKTREVKKGDLILSNSMSFGRAFITLIDGYIHDGWLRLRCDESIIDKEYLYYFLTSSIAQHQFKAVATGSVVNNLKADTVKAAKVALPSLDVQKKIASVLSVLDDKIVTNEAINRNLFELAMSVYNERFGHIEKTKLLEDYPVRIYSGGTPKTSINEYWNGDVPWLSSGETANEFVISTNKYITQLGVDNSSTKWAGKYDVVTASAGQGHTRGQTSMILLDTCINQSVIVTHADKVYMPFIFFNIYGRYEELRVLSDGTSTRGSLTTKIMAKLRMPDVSQIEIVDYAEFLWPIINRVERNLSENERLVLIRNSILPKLMSGEVDVSDLNI